MAINTFLTCPEDCDTALTLGAISQNQDCTSYSQKYAQVSDIIIQPDAATAPLDWTSSPVVSVVSAEIDNSDTSGTKSKWLVVEGGIEAPEKTVDEYPKRKTKTSFRTYTLTARVKNLDDDQYEFLRGIQCGSTDFKIWYATVGGRIFGGADGIDILSMDVDFVYSDDRNAKEVANVIITWEADGDPERGIAPDEYIVGIV